MTRDEQRRYQPLLESIAEELRRRLATTDESQAPVAPDRAIGRLTRVDAMQAQQVALAMRRRQEQRLQRVEHALALIARGEYGACTRCREDIDPARLAVAPDTFVCVACAEQLRAR